MGAPARVDKCPIFCRDGRRRPLIFYSTVSTPKRGMEHCKTHRQKIKAVSRCGGD